MRPSGLVGNFGGGAALDAISLSSGAGADPTFVENRAVANADGNLIALYVELPPQLHFASILGRWHREKIRVVTGAQDGRGCRANPHHGGLPHLAFFGSDCAARSKKLLRRGHRLTVVPELKGLDARGTDALIPEDESNVTFAQFGRAFAFVVGFERNEGP